MARSSLRLITMTYRGFDGRAHDGRVVVAARVAPGVVKVFRALYEGGYPIRRMVPIDAYGNDDDRSLAADNTAGFNCRRVAGTTSWSMHACHRLSPAFRLAWLARLLCCPSLIIGFPPCGYCFAGKGRILDCPRLIHKDLLAMKWAA